MRSLLVVLAALLAVHLGLGAVPPGEPAGGSPFGDFGDDGPLVLAHRGGMGLWPENTLHAFREALALGVDVLEMDARLSADGRLVAFHDARLERTTDGEGPVAHHSLAELAALDAGHDFSRDGGRTFPYRGRGLRIPAIGEVLRALPGARLSIELKDDDAAAAEALCALLSERGAGGRVLVASFHQDPMDAFRARCPHMGTAATPREAWRFFLASAIRRPNLARPRAAVLYLFPRLGPFEPVTRRLVADAAALNLPVYVWGSEVERSARRLLDQGVAGLTADHPDRLLAMLGRQGGRRARREPRGTRGRVRRRSGSRR